MSSKMHFCKREAAKQDQSMPKWRMQDLNLVKGAAKQRQGEDRLRADAWRKEREAELEAVVNRTYDGMEIPELRDLVNQASTVVAPIIAEFDRSAAQHYPAEFSRPRLGISLTPGGFPPKVRDKVRRDAAKHLAARHAYMLANSAGFTTEVVSDAIIRTTDNPEVVDVLEKLAVPNRATPSLQPPGPAIGILRTLLPHPEEWGFDGYADASSPLLPATVRPALASPNGSKDDDE
jgi:hypothetical protein